jgi:short-subunit dehydrogenase
MTPGSKLVLVGSSVTFVGLPRAEAYGASKAGIAYLADSLRLDLANHMIDVVLVEPGFVETPLTDRNHFDMPFIVSAKNAATRILTGVNKGKTTIRFPLRLMATLTLLSWLPWRWIHSMTIRK